MRSLENRTVVILAVIAFVSGTLFSQLWTIFFSADDFYNIYLTFNQPVSAVLEPFFFARRDDFLFYRPLSTQFFFYLGNQLFGLNPFWFHLISVFIFSIILILVYQLAHQITGKKSLAILTFFFYSISASNFVRLAWISQIQELLFTSLSFGSLFFWLRYWEEKKKKSLIISLTLFVFSLMSKESAVVLPIIFLIVYLCCRLKSSFTNYCKHSLLFFSILAIYSFGRFILIGVSTGGHYFTSFSIPQIFNTLTWYVLWSFGVPELFVNFSYLQGGALNLHVVEYLVTDMSDILIRYGTLFILVGLSFVLAVTKSTLLCKEKRFFLGWNIFFFSVLFFFVSLLPHLFSPFHKFPYELTMSLFGFSLGLSFIIFQASSAIDELFTGWRHFFVYLIIAVYLAANMSSMRVESWNSWVVQRGRISENVLHYLQLYQQDVKHSDKIVFYNDIPVINQSLGISRQLLYALSGNKAIRLLYGATDTQVLFEDGDVIPGICSEEIILLPSSKFFPF